MKEYLETNLADLEHQYLRNRKTATALSLLQSAHKHRRPPNLTRLLRNHSEGDVNDADTRKRDSFDYLLAFYGLVEIASIIRYVPALVPVAFREEALAHLSQPDVKNYYEINYPLLLPRQFRLRMEGRQAIEQPGDAGSMHGLFGQFLAMVNRLEDDDDVETFLWFVDDGSIESRDLSSTLRILRRPDRTLKALMKDPSQRTISEDSVSGAQKFLTFCGALDGLLADAEPFPVFQAAVWHYYAYWFNLIGQRLGETLRDVLNLFLSWTPVGTGPGGVQRVEPENLASAFWASLAPNASSEAVHIRLTALQDELDESGLRTDSVAIHDYVASSQGAIKRLLSGSYGRALPGQTLGKQ